MSYFIGGNAKIEFAGQTRYYVVAGLPRENVELFLETGSIGVEEGKPLQNARLGEVAVGSLYSKGNLFKRPVKVGDKISINGKDVKVVSIMKEIGNPGDDQNIYMFTDTFEEIFGKTDRVDMVYVQVQPGEDIKEVSDRLDRRLMQFRGVNEKTKDYTLLTLSLIHISEPTRPY